MALYPRNAQVQYLLAFCNSTTAEHLLRFLSPTLNVNAGEIDKLPILPSQANETPINRFTNTLITQSEADWDTQETSWDFKRNPLI